MIASAVSPSPRCKQPVVLFDRGLRVLWTNAPGFPHVNAQPWEFCLEPAEPVKTAFARCLANLGAPPFSACLDLEGCPYRYQVTLANTGCEEVPVIALCRWTDGRLDLLTAREREIVRLTVDGLSAVDISQRLGIERSTIDTHRGRIRSKLRLTSICALGCWAANNLPMEGGAHE